jgi:hypothetical protein
MVYHQECEVAINAKFQTSKQFSHGFDPYATQLTKESVDIRRVVVDDPERNWLCEESVNAFIRIVVNQFNRAHNQPNMYSHLSSQAYPLFKAHGEKVLLGDKSPTLDGIVKDKPFEVRSF